MDIKEQIQNVVDEIQALTSKGLVGVDIGLSSVKVCEVSATRGKYKLLRFASVNLPEGALIDDDMQQREEISKAIKHALTLAKIKTKSAAIGLWGPNTTSKRLQVPDGNPQEIEDQVIWESEQYIPFGLDDSNISHSVLGKNEGGGLDVMMAACTDDVAENYQELMKESGLRPKIIDLSIFALSNTFEVAMGKDLESFSDGTAIIDFGAQTTKVVVYKNNGPIFTKEIQIGGGIITEEIQRQMGLNYQDAENLKSLGEVETGNLPEEVLGIMNDTLEKFFEEIKKTLNFFLTASAEDQIRYCFITGGTSLLPGLVEGMEGILETKVEYLNPFKNITYDPKQFSNEIVSYIATRGCIALGLAMRNEA